MNVAAEDSETAEYVSVEYDTLLVHPVRRGQPGGPGLALALCSSGVRSCCRYRGLHSGHLLLVIGKGTRWNLPPLPVRSALT
jgi:hypothetical protein